MTVDLSTARVGSEVTTHAGSKLIISARRNDKMVTPIEIWFKGYESRSYLYRCNGNAWNGEPSPLDIIAISPPPMSDAERLAEIAKMLLDFPMPAVGDMYFSIHATKWNVLLALAQGRTP